MPRFCVLDEHTGLTWKSTVVSWHLRGRSRMGALGVHFNGEMDEVNFPILNLLFHVNMRAL